MNNPEQPIGWGITYRGELLKSVWPTERDALKEMRRRNTTYPHDAAERAVVALYLHPASRTSPDA